MLAMGCLSWGATIAGAATTVSYGPVTIQSDSPTYASTIGGYVEYRFTIINSDTERDREVRLVIPADTQGQGHHIRQMQRRVRVPAGSRVRVSMWQPPLRMNGSRVRVFIDGERQRETQPMGTASHGIDQYSRWNAGQTVLVGRNVDARSRAHLETDSSGTTRHSRAHRHVVRADRPIREWSDNWLSYSRFHGLVLEADELRGAPASVREAIWSYVRLGGTLLVLGEIEEAVPSPWRARRQAVEVGDERVDAYAVGFGRCWVMAADALERWEDAGNDSRLRAFFEHGGATWERVRGVDQANRDFPVIDNLGVPVRGLLVLMILFAVVLGPVNVMMLARWNRRMWMLWTTPMIAVLFSAAVFGYAAFAEGWRAHSRVTGLTLLEEEHHRASTFGWAGFYSPLTPADGLRFDRYTELTPQVRTSGWSNEGSPRFIDWTEGQHLSAGWVQARIPSHFTIRRSQTRRERLTFEVEAGGNMQVTNGLGADIHRLYVRNEAGQLYRAQGVQAGGSASLVLVAEVGDDARDGDDERMRLDELYAGDWLSAIDTLAMSRGGMAEATLHQHVARNTYLAVVDGSPFMEPGLGVARQRESESVVYGIMAEPLRGGRVDGD